METKIALNLNSTWWLKRHNHGEFCGRGNRKQTKVKDCMANMHKFPIKYIVYTLWGLSSFLLLAPYLGLIIAIELRKKNEFYSLIQNFEDYFDVNYFVIQINTSALAFLISCIIIFSNADERIDFLNRRPLTFESIFMRIWFILLLLFNALGIMFELLGLALRDQGLT
jgi:hypothetical protein